MLSSQQSQTLLQVNRTNCFIPLLADLSRMSRICRMHTQLASHTHFGTYRQMSGMVQNWKLVVVADTKTPTDWHLEGAIFLDMETQARLGYNIFDLIPKCNYGRKNIGYLYAIHHGAQVRLHDPKDPGLGFHSLLMLFKVFKSSAPVGTRRGELWGGFCVAYRDDGDNSLFPASRFPMRIMRSCLMDGAAPCCFMNSCRVHKFDMAKTQMSGLRLQQRNNLRFMSHYLSAYVLLGTRVLGDAYLACRLAKTMTSGWKSRKKTRYLLIAMNCGTISSRCTIKLTHTKEDLPLLVRSIINKQSSLWKGSAVK